MPPWLQGQTSIGRYLEEISLWIQSNQVTAILLAIAAPLAFLSVRAAINRRRRVRVLEDERTLTLANSRLPTETLERNRKEEARYRRESRGEKPKAKGPSGPRFK